MCIMNIITEITMLLCSVNIVLHIPRIGTDTLLLYTSFHYYSNYVIYLKFSTILRFSSKFVVYANSFYFFLAVCSLKRRFLNQIHVYTHRNDSIYVTVNLKEN